MADRDFDASEQLLDQVRQALADDRPLCIQGSDSKAFLGTSVPVSGSIPACIAASSATTPLSW